MEANSSPFNYFVSDERSPKLFMGYTVAALRLKEQLRTAKLAVDSEHLLFIYQQSAAFLEE